MKGTRCENCAFYEDRLCHRYPPTVYSEPDPVTTCSTLYSFPRVDPDDWCGEFEQVEECFSQTGLFLCTKECHENL